MDTLSIMDEKVEDPNSPAFLLNNLDIAVTDCFADSSHNVAARNAAAQLISHQVCFYMACLLRGFEAQATPVPPNVVVVGAGFIGKAIIEALIANGCTTFLHIFCRGDLAAQSWRRRGLKSSPSMSRLMKDARKADIVILSTGLSGFTNMSKQLLPYITHSTAVITSSLGLQRRRIHASLKTLGVFRAYIEPHALIRHVRLTARQAGIHHKSFDEGVPVVIKPTPAGPIVTGGNLGDSDDDEGDYDDTASAVSAVDSIRTFTSKDQFVFLAGQATGGLVNAADLIVQRTPDIRHIVSVLENYFCLLGLKQIVARAQALMSVLGYSENTAIGIASASLATASMPTVIAEIQRQIFARKSEFDEGGLEDDEDEEKARKEKQKQADAIVRRIQVLAAARAQLEVHSATFQRHLSRFVRVVDVPRLSALVSEANKSTRQSRRAAQRSSRIAGGSMLNTATNTTTTTTSITAAVSAAVAAVQSASPTHNHSNANEGNSHNNSNPNPNLNPESDPASSAHPLIHPASRILHIFAHDVKFKTDIVTEWDDESAFSLSSHTHAHTRHTHDRAHTHAGTYTNSSGGSNGNNADDADADADNERDRNRAYLQFKQDRDREEQEDRELELEMQLGLDLDVDHPGAHLLAGGSGSSGEREREREREKTTPRHELYDMGVGDGRDGDGGGAVDRSALLQAEMQAQAKARAEAGARAKG